MDHEQGEAQCAIGVASGWRPLIEGRQCRTAGGGHNGSYGSCDPPPRPSSLFQVPLLEASGSTPAVAHMAWN